MAKTARISGAIEYSLVYAISNSTNNFWFNCNCTNFTLIGIINAGPEGSSCIPQTNYFSLYNYDDLALSNMIFKNE